MMFTLKSVSRREFIRRSSAAGFGYWLNGKWVELEAAPALPRPAGAADRVGVGFIGVGIRGHILMEGVKATGQANLVAACDCYQGHLERAKERTEGRIETCFAQYRMILERKDVDAVVVATPDHWHTPIVLDALEAGKDVYIEKPMTHTVDEGPKVIGAARRLKRVVQVGSQGRSSPLQKKAREVVASGQLGQVTKVVASYNRNSSTGAWNYPIPPDLKNGVNFNWEAWLGPAPRAPFDPERVFRYRKYWDYSGGISTDLFVHLITSIHFIMDARLPRSVMAAGDILRWKDGREVPDTLDAVLEYDGFQVNMGSTFNSEGGGAEQGMQFLGTEGSLVLRGSSLSVEPENRREGYGYAIDSWPKSLQERFWNEDDHRGEARPGLRREGSVVYRAGERDESVVLHLAEFFACVRSRKECSENPEIGHYAAAAGHMVNISCRSGQKVFWDSARGTVKT